MGFFIINNAPVFERFGYVKAEKSGFINASQTVFSSNNSNEIRMIMLPKSTTAIIDSGTVETISLSNGASVKLQGAYIDVNEQEYNGTVKVTLHYIDPTLEGNQNQTPGMLYGQNQLGEESGVQTKGMLVVELTGNNGQDLSLATGNTALISIPISSSLLATAPQTIPLGYFNETFGHWVEEGEASLEGNMYVGEVSHFTIWNAGIYFDGIILTVKITDSNNLPISDGLVKFTNSQYGSSLEHFNVLGEKTLNVPINQPLDLDLLFYSCYEYDPVYSTTIGPFSSDTILELSIDISDIVITEKVIGSVTNCEGMPLENGYIVITAGDRNYFTPMNNGNINRIIHRCLTQSPDFSYYAVDYDNPQTSGVIIDYFTPTETDIETLATCNNENEFLTFKIEGLPVRYFVNPHMSSTNLDETHIGTMDNNPNRYIGLRIGQEPGTYTLDNQGWITFRDPSGQWINIGNLEELTLEVINYGEIGEYIDIEFSATFTDNSGNISSVIGEGHLIRTE